MITAWQIPPQMKVFLACFSVLLSACTASAPLTATPLPAPKSEALAPTRTVTIPPTRFPTPTTLPSASPSPQAKLQLCSPLEGFTLSQLADTIVNPFYPPQSGSDQPHQGIDFAERRDGMAVAGMPVQAVLPGIVAASQIDRFPYGNAILIETPLMNLPRDWVTVLDLPELNPGQPRDPALTCPGVTTYPNWRPDVRSLYLLYAHMQTPSTYKPGDVIACGDPIGAVGDSGNALNPHLHLETRVGPAGARFSSLAHYDASASLEEMDNYCAWRVSGWFVLLDPLQLLAHQP